MKRADVAIIGGGIIGLATAYHLALEHPERCLVVLEKEAGPARHQTGRNSGVLHSGIYYPPGSLKAANCRQGKRALEAFCRAQGVPFEICGKVIVAVDQTELAPLRRIYERGQQNGVRCQLIDRERLAQLEPHAAGIKAIHVPEAGIVDFRQVCERLKEIVLARGGQFIPRARVTAVRPGRSEVVIRSTAGDIAADFVVNCAGLHSDRVARMSGARPKAQIVPFRGEYYELTPEARPLCRNLIYPVPDPGFPFLGVHFTRMIDGTVQCGPNAVLALAREGYRRRDINLRDLVETLSYPGFLKLARAYWAVGLGETWRSVSKAAFVRALQRLMPEIRAEHLRPAPAGVRAQAVARDGRMLDDFLIEQTARVVNVCNAPSPAATASLHIGRIVVEKLAKRF